MKNINTDLGYIEEEDNEEDATDGEVVVVDPGMSIED